MIAYITDRNGFILLTAASDLPNNQLIVNDILVDDLESGVKTLELTLAATKEVRENCTCGNYVMAYNIPFTIVTSSFNTAEKTVVLYCEDAGLDLRNKICSSVAKSSKSFQGWIEATLGTSSVSGWNYNINIVNKNKTLEYTNEENALVRLRDILKNYDAEMYFSYEIKGFEWVSRTINFIQKRGSESVHKLYKDKEVKDIIREESVNELATVWIIPNLSKLSGYSSATKSFPIEGNRKHSYSVVGNEVRCNEAIKKWKSKLDTDGRIVSVVSVDYKNAASAISYAVREMEKIVEPAVNYTIELLKLPEGITVGDYVYVLDASDEILLNARVQTLTTSESSETYEIVLADFVEVESRIVPVDFETFDTYTLSITSSSGLIGKGTISTVLSATVFMNGKAITSASELPSDMILNWYSDGVKVGSGFTYTVSNLTNTKSFSCKLEEVV